MHKGDAQNHPLSCPEEIKAWIKAFVFTLLILSDLPKTIRLIPGSSDAVLPSVPHTGLRNLWPVVSSQPTTFKVKLR